MQTSVTGVTPVCDPNAPQCNCDAAVHDVLLTKTNPTIAFDLSVVDNNNAPISNVTIILLCNDVVWVQDNTRTFIIPLATIFWIK